jgi:hypothetical protein
LTEHLQSIGREEGGSGGLRRDLVDVAEAQLKRSFDFNNGGFGTAPKFPHPMDVQFLLRQWRRHKDDGRGVQLLEMVTRTLDKMAAGGIYDHLGGGFARYSVDERWLVPHFEKMLYDNALLVGAYLDAYLATDVGRVQTVSAGADPPESGADSGGTALAEASLSHPTLAQEWMEAQQVEPPIVDHVCRIVGELSFKGAGVATPMTSLEGQCVQDADRLDALGAVGIGRTFAYGGHKGQAMHNPELSPTQHDSFDAYKSNAGTTINHFYEKLLLLKDRMNTSAARKLAAGRHAYMEQFLAQFLAEWEGKK